MTGAPNELEDLRENDLARWLRPRARDSHKGDHGRVLCIGGDSGHGGAIMLAAEAALRCGAGLVDVATRALHVPALLARRPEVMARAVDDGRVPAALLASADVILCGPGLGQGDWGAAMFAQVLDDARPGTRLVLDADALNLLARRPRPLPADSILTPHPGEAARLLGIEASEVQRDRAGALQGLCARYAAVVVLKGAGTLVGATGRGARRISAGNPGMAVGGMGDVLAGTIAGLCAQGLEAADAAACGALLHACAGDAAAGEGGERGLLPADLMPWLRRLANPQATA